MVILSRFVALSVSLTRKVSLLQNGIPCYACPAGKEPLFSGADGTPLSSCADCYPGEYSDDRGTCHQCTDGTSWGKLMSLGDTIGTADTGCVYCEPGKFKVKGLTSHTLGGTAVSNDAVAASATCEASLGDGWGGTEEWVGNVGSLAECAALVIDQYPTANGVTYCPTGSSGTLSCSVRDCWAHLDMVGISTTTPQYESCFLDLECRPCPAGTQTTWQQSWLGGDGIGGTEELLSDQPSPEACAELVRTTRPEANGASFAGQKCYAEFGMTGVDSATGDATYYVTAEFADPPTTSETFQTGDGTGTSELLLGTAADAQACAALVKSERPSANGATYQQFSDPDAAPVRTHQACFAEYGMTQITGSANSMWQSTFFLNTGCDTCAAGKVSG